MAGDGYKSAMPAYEDVLSDAEIIASLSYIKSRWPKEVVERHDQINQSAAQ
jgi:S-disulfanyl-L-cysteine oxidoreductase SoxD